MGSLLGIKSKRFTNCTSGFVESSKHLLVETSILIEQGNFRFCQNADELYS